jgi:NhaP-type Na+/H+ or K+/H+ antiporter
MLSATDPVAVVAALHELGAPKKLSIVIDGEALLNDGSAFVFFLIFIDMSERMEEGLPFPVLPRTTFIPCMYVLLPVCYISVVLSG